MSTRDNAPVTISFVIIGYNEADFLAGCLESVKSVQLPPDVTAEVLYVDGGSTDNSVAVAEAAGIDRILGGEKRRKASENRNIGFAHARGTYIQFLDGDMQVAPDWPAAALAHLEAHPDVAAVCGNIVEASTSALARAFDIDWAPREGPIRHCGGAALFRRDVLERMGGFPEEVAYGEEPLLCWRIRNELGLSIHQLNRRMVNHALGHRGIWDYWRRNVRVGATYAEIAYRCMGTKDPLWLREAVTNLLWAAVLFAAVGVLAVGPGWARFGVLGAGIALLARKAWQVRAAGLGVGLIYAVHTYVVKIPLAFGELRWALRARRPASDRS